MSEKPKKAETVGEIISRQHPSVMSEYQISQLKEIGKRHAEAAEHIRRVAQPVIERIAQVQEQFQMLKPKNYVMKYYRPVEYDILDELRELNKNTKKPTHPQQEDTVIIYNTKDGSLDRNMGGKYFSYDLSENGKRKKLLDILLEQDRYIKTEQLRTLLGCPTNQAVAKIVQTFNDYASNSLRLKKVKVIDGKKGSGYRINPNIHIEKD
ncbi:MAG: hypothetical protein FGM57_03050 [Candidatus Taylorbacteria bacterium]|nr:hypothetical protein [Candidatus Taylorbacteria bacterium]